MSLNALRLENINLHSPYRVWQTKEDNHYYFQTDTDIQYDIVFEANGNEVMLYITETGDGKQMFRNRLFVIWFNTYVHHDKYIIRTAEGKMDGEDNFTRGSDPL